MNKDDILRMAREAGYNPAQFTSQSTLERFASLVAAAERESCAQVADDLLDKASPFPDYNSDVGAAIRGRGEDVDMLAKFAKRIAAAERDKFCAVLRQLHDSYSLASMDAPRNKA